MTRLRSGARSSRSHRPTADRSRPAVDPRRATRRSTWRCAAARIVTGVNKDVKAFVRTLERAGLTVERSGGGHYRVRTAEGATVAFLPFSPSTNRWKENTLTQLRRRGIEID